MWWSRTKRWIVSGEFAFHILALAMYMGSGTQALSGNYKDFKKPDAATLKKTLSPIEYEVTQEEGTEPPFKNKFWDNHADGIYVDVVSGEPLFSSLDKYESGTGWPSFTKPIDQGVVTLRGDNRLFSQRTEVRSKIANSHLGHVFEDGPQPTGKRYCMNSASLRFIPVASLAAEGYGDYTGRFAASPTLAKAIFAGGCFWCMEAPFDALVGVTEVLPGYSGGTKINPTYEEVSAGGTGHAEVVQVTYDPKKISYQNLLDVYWRQIDPFNANGQFCDQGTQYRSVIFVSNTEERSIAEASKAAIGQKFAGQTISTEIANSSAFYPAEDYHQHYYKKNPIRYKFYRTSCGRDRRLEAVWGPEAAAHK